MNIHHGSTTNTLFKSKSWDETSQELRGLRLVSARHGGRRRRKRLVVKTPDKADKLPVDLLPTARLGIPPRPIDQHHEGWIPESVRAKARGGGNCLFDCWNQKSPKSLAVHPVGLEIYTSTLYSDAVSELSESDSENSPMNRKSASPNFRC